MSKLKHYEGDGWEVKVKYDEEMGMVLWKDAKVGALALSVDFDASLVIGEMIHRPVGCCKIEPSTFNDFCDHLNFLTRNEREFKNDNFDIKVWETEDKIGAETVWIREGFEWNANINDLEFARDISIDKEERTELFVENIYPYFGMSGTKSDIQKSEIDYTFTDLCKALERAEQETSKDAKRKMFLKELDQLLDKHYGSNQTKEG